MATLLSNQPARQLPEIPDQLLEGIEIFWLATPRRVWSAMIMSVSSGVAPKYGRRLQEPSGDEHASEVPINSKCLYGSCARDLADQYSKSLSQSVARDFKLGCNCLFESLAPELRFLAYEPAQCGGNGWAYVRESYRRHPQSALKTLAL